MSSYHYCPTIGPFVFSITTDDAAVALDISRIYSHHEHDEHQGFIDFHVTVKSPSQLRKIFRPQVVFFRNSRRPFKPLPRDQGYAMLEWGMNWCIANHAHQFLILHAGVVERNGCAVVMPATQGAGKSTLTAALSFNGWRLFSDELALISPITRHVSPVPRPINLKNASIAIIDRYIGGGVFSREARDTAKGTVALLQPPKDSVTRMHETAPIGAVVFPRYQAGADTQIESLAPDEAFREVLNHSFNYHVLGHEGFELLHAIFTETPAYTLVYSDFDNVNAALSALIQSR